MSVKKLKVLAGVPTFDIRTILDGTEYGLRFDWHDREGRWYFDVLSSTGEIITAGIKIVPNWPLYSRETSAASPKGDFMCLTFDGSFPGLADFGQRSAFLYIEKGTT